jgi:DNA-binding PadR family transcriptional regulator
MGPGALYGTIKRLLGQSYIEESIEQIDLELGHERRRHYRLTDSGRTALGLESTRLETAISSARHQISYPLSS